MSEISTNDKLLADLLDAVKNQKRPELIKVPVYGLYNSEERTFLYSDEDKTYFQKCSFPDNKGVRSVKAFATCISEELKRRNNETGSKATVHIGLNGGMFIPDDNFGGYNILFNRLNSQQWNTIAKAINIIYDHRNFLLLIQSLKPSFAEMGIDFQEVFAAFSKLRLIGNSTITSNPIMTADGAQEQGYICRYKLENGCDGEEVVPSGFEIKVPFAKAGDFKYVIPIDLLYTRNEDNELEIRVLCPDFENIEEQAIIDEANYIKQETEKYSELLVLSDF